MRAHHQLAAWRRHVVAVAATIRAGCSFVCVVSCDGVGVCAPLWEGVARPCGGTVGDRMMYPARITRIKQTQ